MRISRNGFALYFSKNGVFGKSAAADWCALSKEDRDSYSNAASTLQEEQQIDLRTAKNKSLENPIGPCGSSEERAPLNVRKIFHEITEDNSEVRDSWNRVNLKRWVGEKGDMATPKESINLTAADLKAASRVRLLTPECSNCIKSRSMEMLQNARFVSVSKEAWDLYTGEKYGL